MLSLRSRVLTAHVHKLSALPFPYRPTYGRLLGVYVLPHHSVQFQLFMSLKSWLTVTLTQKRSREVETAVLLEEQPADSMQPRS